MKTWKETLDSIADGEHAVHYYTNDESLARMVGYFAGSGLAHGEAAIIIPQREHRQLFEDAISAASGKLASEWVREKQLVMVDAEDALSRFIVDGELNWERFHSEIGGIVESFAGRKLRAYGEMVNLLWHWGKRRAALDLEGYWNRLLAGRNFSLLCAYRVDPLSADIYDEEFQRVCHCHGTIVPSEEPEKFQQRVQAGIEKVLGTSYKDIVAALASLEDPRLTIPEAQKCLLWLSRHMPAATRKILAR